MTKLQLRCIEIVNSAQGIKGVLLSSKLMAEFLDVKSNDILSQIFDLIEKGEIVEIEYELPTMNFRTKSFLLPKGTSVNINKVVHGRRT